jgi:hypothetical protein
MRYRLIIAVLGVLLVSFSLGPQDARAYSPGPKQFINADNTFYVYVKAGEKVSASFLRFVHEEIFNTTRGDVAVTIEGPDIQPETCILSKDLTSGQGCRFEPKQATKTGIWRVNFQVPEGSNTFDQVSPTVRWTKNWFSWNITVMGENGESNGRIWTERYALRQPPAPEYKDDFTHYYVSEDGYIYRAVTRGYNGQISILSADSIGIRKGKDCVSAYQSSEVSSKEFSPALGSCGNAYKLFFEEPAGDLPTMATRWDGKQDWIRPKIQKPTISELNFIPDNSSDQLSGYITFYLRNFLGQYQIKIDVDNDGSFNGSNDVLINQQMKKLDSGLMRVRFSGSDRSGQVIQPTRTIGIKVEITKVAEIHFVAADVEGRTGGLELVRINGENAPSKGLCWNDTELAPLATELTTPVLDGRGCRDSTGGLHTWAYADESWGNARYIDDWVYASAKLVGSNQITYPLKSNNEELSRPVDWTAVIVGVSASGIVLFLAAFAVIRKYKLTKKKPVSPPRSEENIYSPENTASNQEKDRW